MTLRGPWLLLLWALPLMIGLWLALQWFPAVYLPDGSYVPIGPDSFYHAARILEALDGSLIQFDQRMHLPEGSWISWPWAYDWLSARILSVALAVTGIQDPMVLLVHFPLAGLMANTALFLAICRELDVSRGLALVAMLAYVSLPLTQELHAIGAIDHHYAEHFFVLLTLWLLVRWSAAPSSLLRAGILGACLGIAPAFHLSLVVLQLPVLAVVAYMWVRGSGGSFHRSSLPFSAALLVSTCLILWPSGPFWDGQFNLYTLSGFHLLAAVVSSAIVLGCSRCRFSPANLLLSGLGLLFVALLVRMQLQTGLDFLRSNIDGLEYIQETGGLFRDSLAGVNPLRWVSMYSGLLWLLPLAVAFSAFEISRSRDSGRLAYHVFALVGLVMLFSQYRLHYFGSFALILTPLLACEALRQNSRRPWVWTLVPAVGMLGLVAPQVAPMLGMRVQPGGEFYYSYTRPIYADLERACQLRPGAVFADDILGHYIRFHSACSVFTNMFKISPQHVIKGRESDYLMSLSASDFLAENPGADYVMVVRRDDFTQELPSDFVQTINAGLRRELIWGAEGLPSEYQLIKRLVLDKGDGKFEPIAAFYRLGKALPDKDRGKSGE